MPYNAPTDLLTLFGDRPIPVATTVRDSVGATGTLTAGAIGATPAGTNIVTLTPGLGTYSFYIVYGYGGTADVLNNFRLNIDGTNVIDPLVALPVANTLQILTAVFTLLAGQPIRLQTSQANGVAGSVFTGMIVATRIR
jgi:hypothetical protein